MADLLDLDNQTWKPEALVNLVSEEEVMEIQKIKFLHVECEDKLYWIATKHGIFSVKSCYSLMTNEDREVDDTWGLIWGSKLHERLKLFLWRFASNIIPVNMVVIDRIGRGD